MQLTAEILHVIYEQTTNNEGRSWYVLKTDKGKASGEMLWRPATGERVVLDGEWSAYKGARQFKFKAAMLDIPCDPRDQLRYVCANATGIGAAIEAGIWEQWGETWWVDAEPDVVPRLSGKTFCALRNSMNEFSFKREESESVAWLAGKGASMGLAKLAWDKWHDGMQGVVRENCYRLTELPHYGFRDVDREIRKEFGIGDDDPRRVRAGIIYAMRQQTEWGATLIGWTMLLGAVSELLAGAGSPQLIADETKALFESGDLQPFANVAGVAMTADYEAEREILEFVE